MSFLRLMSRSQKLDSDSDSASFLTQLQDHGIIVRSQEADWYCYPQGYFWRDCPPARPYSIAPARPHGTALPHPLVSTTEAFKNTEKEAKMPSTIAHNAKRETETFETDKASAANNGSTENEDPTVTVTFNASREVLVSPGDKENTESVFETVDGSCDSVERTFSPLDGQETMKSSSREVISTGAPENEGTPSNAEQESETFETEKASAAVNESMESEDPTVIDTGISSRAKSGIPVDNNSIKNVDESVASTLDSVVTVFGRLEGQETMESLRREVVLSTEVPENHEAKSRMLSRVASTAEQETETFETEKASAQIYKRIENEDLAVTDSGIISRDAFDGPVDKETIENIDESLDGQEPMKSSSREVVSSTGAPIKGETETNMLSTLASSAKRETETFETVKASAAVNQIIGNEDPTMTYTGIVSRDALDDSGDNEDIESPGQMNRQDAMGKSRHEVISSTGAPENAEAESNTPPILHSIAEQEVILFDAEKSSTVETLNTENDTSVSTFEKNVSCDDGDTKNFMICEYDRAEQSDVRCDEEATEVADHMLLTQCNSADEPDVPSDDEELLTIAEDELPTHPSVCDELSLTNHDAILSTQYNSGDEESVPTADDVPSPDFYFVADEAKEHVDDSSATNRCKVGSELFPFRYDKCSIENTEDIFDMQCNLEQSDEPRDNETEENASQSETSFGMSIRGDLSDAVTSNKVNMEIPEDTRPAISGEQTDNGAMEYKERSVEISDHTLTTNGQCQRDILDPLHVTCGNVSLRAPFLQRNRKRTFLRMYEPRVSTLQSTLLLKKTRKVVLTTDVCAPDLNVPSRKKTTNIHRCDHYRVHILAKETNGRVITATTSFCLKAYQCHFCVFNCSDMEGIWQHCSSIHGDSNQFYAVETTDGVFHLLVEQRMLSQNGNPDEICTDAFSMNQPPLSTVTEPPSFKRFLCSSISLPIRQYYHDVTFHPIGLSEWLFNMKDGDYDPDWRGIVDTSALFDMTDISTNEKHFMTFWNNFMRSHPILSEIQLSSQLLSFVQENSNVLLEYGLEDELIGHISNMWVEGHIGRWTMLEAMKTYNGHAAHHLRVLQNRFATLKSVRSI